MDYKNYELVDFRAPRVGDYFLSLRGLVLGPAKANHIPVSRDEARYIVEKIEKPEPLDVEPISEVYPRPRATATVYVDVKLDFKQSRAQIERQIEQLERIRDVFEGA